jgi:hypothetical protein
METIVGHISDDVHLGTIEQELRAVGISDISVHEVLGPADFWKRQFSRRKARLILKDATNGALIGLGFGILIGVIAGVLNCRLMDCPIGTSLIFLTLITLYCTFAGALIGMTIGLDRAERSRLSYVANAHRDQALFIVETSVETAPEARHILAQHGIVIDVNCGEVKRMEE